MTPKQREYYINYSRRYRDSHPGINSKFSQRKIDSWRGFIPVKTHCAICNETIWYNSGDRKKSIHFDHKNTNKAIKRAPYIWLRNNKRTTENEKIWMSCDFGMLCWKCNRKLPTKNRKKWVKKIYKYVME